MNQEFEPESDKFVKSFNYIVESGVTFSGLKLRPFKFGFFP